MSVCLSVCLRVPPSAEGHATITQIQYPCTKARREENQTPMKHSSKNHMANAIKTFAWQCDLNDGSRQAITKPPRRARL
eukprot:10048976-Alexandrium_andersonii.AAC.1